MPSAPSRRRSRSVYEGEEDGQSSEVETTKRPRRDRDPPDDEDDEDESDVENPFATPLPSQRRPRYQTSDPGSATPEEKPPRAKFDNHTFHPGAIVRVMVENFVTYEHAEFLPGPKLNMVIGPNGTGKSSLVCAICLGLGFKPHNLGRSNKVGEYVKHGKDAAIIEVELQKRSEDRANYVIKVQITREDNKQKWWINGRDSTHKAVEQLTSRLRIQIDNLCQFLPQDRVAEFAGLSPVQLLQETLRAAAPVEMSEWHNELKSYHGDYKQIKESLDSCSENLKGLETRQQALQADVDRLNERETIKQKIEDWRNARVCAQYDTAKATFEQAKRKRKEAEKTLKELREATGPALKELQEHEEYRNGVAKVLENRQQDLEYALEDADDLLEEIEDEDKDRQDYGAQIEAERSSMKERKDEIAKVRRKIAELEGKLSSGEPTAFVAADWNTKIREKEHSQRELQAEQRTVETQRFDSRQLGTKANQERKMIEQKMQSLESDEGKQLALLHRLNSDAARGWEWLAAHQDEFEKEIFGPPMMCCSLTDKEYSRAVQSLLAADDFQCFTTQSKADHKKLSDVFYAKMGLLVTIRTCVSDFRSFHSPMASDELRRFGLDGFAIDYLQGPDPVLAMLCSEKRLHSSGVALRDVTEGQYHQLVDGDIISQWAAGNTMCRVIRRREYGPEAMTTSTRRIRDSPYWTDQPVNDAERSKLQKELNEKTSEVQEWKQQFDEATAKLKDVNEKLEEVTNEVTKLKDEKSELQREHTNWVTLPDKIANEKENLNTQKNALDDCEARIFDLLDLQDECLLEKSELTIDHEDEALEEIAEAELAVMNAELTLVEADTMLRILKERDLEIVNQLKEKEGEITQLAKDAEQSKKDATVYMKQVQELVAKGDDLGHYKTLTEDKTVEEIDHEIGAEEAKLELIHGVDPSIMRQFEKRAQEIVKQTERKEELAGKLEGIAHNMDEVRNKWEPELDQLINRINEAFAYNFEQISCAGEVGVHKHEDFDQWSIEIKVKFRENETMQQLTQHRQSGGERAVSTIFYLMALQSMAQAPFRVVDEINQGMDPRNERMVHERMVEIACHEHTSQYFLITPKLLTGLRYVNGMKVLCIASGEHMPPEGRKLDFGKLIGIQRGLKAVSSAA